jgi:hypothetical protein
MANAKKLFKIDGWWIRNETYRINFSMFATYDENILHPPCHYGRFLLLRTG